MKNPSALPAIPLITHDPYFSIWACGLTPTADETRHWTGAEKTMLGSVTIDGTLMRWLGRTGRRPMALKAIDVSPLSTKLIMEELGVRLTVTFTSPLLLDDLDVLSTPISFVRFQTEFIDGKDHDVTVTFSAREGVCHTGETVCAMRQDFFSDGVLHYAYMGQMQQKPLSGSGDHLTQDWGHLFFATDDGIINDMPQSYYVALNYSKQSSKPFCSTLLVGYDDTVSINYFGRMLPAYYARDGKTIVQALREFHEREDEILKKCEKFDRKLLADARKLGGKDYAKIVTAAYRQTIAAHKLVADEDGELLFISKENDSNGCAGTVDVSYPSVPLFLLYNPELVRAMCRPVIRFAKMPVWHYDFAPHDVGRYPTLLGQVYASKRRKKQHAEGVTVAPLYLYPETEDMYDFTKQMPVEESADMLLMLAAAGYADGDYTIAADELEMLKTWCAYLLKYGEDPGEQLCTDDFAGHLARNVNLSAKAVMGIAAFADILEALGKKSEAASYRKEAEKLGKSWLKRASAKDGSTYLTFDGTGWSQKYNLVWDKLFGWNILPESFYKKELESYLPRMNEYGLPLDSRAPYTKSDWSMWIAAMTDDKAIFAAMVKPMAKFLAETTSRVPFSDFYDTTTGCYERFIGRSVQGGVFMPLLMRAWRGAK